MLTDRSEIERNLTRACCFRAPLHISAASSKLCRLFPGKWVLSFHLCPKWLADSTTALRRVGNEVASEKTHPCLLPYIPGRPTTRPPLTFSCWWHDSPHFSLPRLQHLVPFLLTPPKVTTLPQTLRAAFP